MSILAHHPAHERDHVPSTSVALVVFSRPMDAFDAADSLGISADDEEVDQ